MDIKQQISELQERNKERVARAIRLDTFCDVEMDSVTTDSFNAGALAVIGEIREAVKNDKPYGGAKDRIFGILNNLESNLKNI